MEGGAIGEAAASGRGNGDGPSRVRVQFFMRTDRPGEVSAGPRRAGDPDVLEVIVALDGETPLLPGARMDVFFVADETAPAQNKP